MRHRFATAEHTVMPTERARVHFDGIFSTPRLQHAECVAIGPDGYVWCGSENGEVLRIAPDGSRAEVMGTSGGFTLGLAFLGDQALFFCDLKEAAVYRLDMKSRWVERFTGPGIRIPNYPVVDAARNRLLVSDSHHFTEPGPGVWAYDLASGQGELWYDRPLVFANGMALAPAGDALLVCETFARRITRIAIRPRRQRRRGDALRHRPARPAGRHRLRRSRIPVRRLLRAVADVAHHAGRRAPPRSISRSPTAHLFAHPTNVAFDGPVLYTANLGRWHITRIDTDTSGTPLWQQVAAAMAG